MAILTGVNHANIKKGELTNEEVLTLVRARADMFQDSSDLVDFYIATKDRYKFEHRLVREKSLKPDNQMIIIDDRALSITSLDLHLGKLKSRFGDKFRVAVVDYLNQIVLEGGMDQFDWKPQVVISKKLKDLARKHDIVMVSPYQIDSTGEARFAKGILDAADIALLMNAHPKETQSIGFKTTKIRGGREMDVTSGIDWDTLRIDPTPRDAPEEKVKKIKSRKEPEPTAEKGSDTPW
jgi:replicative DNA helicase